MRWRFCWSSRPETLSQVEATAVAWSTAGMGEGEEVGSRQGITGDDAVESHISFPIWFFLVYWGKRGS